MRVPAAKERKLYMSKTELRKETVVEDLKKIIIKTLELESDAEITTDNLVEELQINSIDTMEILVWIENEFEIIFDDDEINVELMSSLNGLAEKVISKVNI